MTKWLASVEGIALVGVVLLGAVAAGWLPAPGEEIETLAGSGGVTFGLLWSCGVCVGRSALLYSAGGMTGIIGWLSLAANLGKLTACVGACAAALTT